MKVLFLLSIGLDRQATSGHLLTAMIQALCEKGHSVHIIQKDTGGELPAIPAELAGAAVTTDTIPFHAADKRNFAARYLTELKYLSACKKRIGKDYDAVFVQSTTVAGFAVKAVRRKLPKAAVTLNVQDIFPYNAVFTGSIKKGSALFRSLAALQRRGYRLADRIITISEDMKELLVEDGTPANKIEVVYNWSYQDTPYKNLDLQKVRQMFNPDEFNVVYAGNIGVMQNVGLLVEAAKLMQDDENLHFHIIGDGVQKEKLEAEVQRCGLKNVFFWPMQPSDLAPYIYSAADVNVIPLAKEIYRTALPSKTATCLACGRPMIFAIGRDSRFGRKLRAQTGSYVTDSDDAEALAGAIREIRRKEETGQNSTDFFRTYCSRSANSKRYAELITQETEGNQL